MHWTRNVFLLLKALQRCYLEQIFQGGCQNAQRSEAAKHRKLSLKTRTNNQAANQIKLMYKAAEVQVWTIDHSYRSDFMTLYPFLLINWIWPNLGRRSFMSVMIFRKTLEIGEIGEIVLSGAAKNWTTNLLLDADLILSKRDGRFRAVGNGATSTAMTVPLFSRILFLRCFKKNVFYVTADIQSNNSNSNKSVQSRTLASMTVVVY